MFSLYAFKEARVMAIFEGRCGFGRVGADGEQSLR